MLDATRRSTVTAVAILWLAAPGSPAHAAPNAATAESPAGASVGPQPPSTCATNALRRTLPSTISPEWATHIATRPDPAQLAPLPGPTDLEGWQQVRAAREATRATDFATYERQFGVSIASAGLGGVPVLDVRPRDWNPADRRVLVYTHGGAYTLLSARSTLGSSALVASRTGLRVVSVDYTTAPQARWREVTDQVVAVFRALLAERHTMQQLALYGDSAGGGLAAGAVLKLRDLGLGMPAALVLWSPWADITETGDSYLTLADAEPAYCYATALGPSAIAYADPADQKHPYVSPVYGDFAAGFPPTLIQGGTREIFLSNFVRLYQAIDQAGGTAKLDLYEGMPHVFQPQLPNSPESIAAVGKMKTWLDRHLPAATASKTTR